MWVSGIDEVGIEWPFSNLRKLCKLDLAAASGSELREAHTEAGAVYEFYRCWIRLKCKLLVDSVEFFRCGDGFECVL